MFLLQVIFNYLDPTGIARINPLSSTKTKARVCLYYHYCTMMLKKHLGISTLEYQILLMLYQSLGYNHNNLFSIVDSLRPGVSKSTFRRALINLEKSQLIEKVNAPKGPFALTPLKLFVLTDKSEKALTEFFSDKRNLKKFKAWNEIQSLDTNKTMAIA